MQSDNRIHCHTSVTLKFARSLAKVRIQKSEAYPVKRVMIQFRFRKANKAVI